MFGLTVFAYYGLMKTENFYYPTSKTVMNWHYALVLMVILATYVVAH